MGIFSRTVQASGNVRKDVNGRIIIDTCVSDHDHLCNAVTDPDINKPICRNAPDTIFADLVGRKGQLIVSVTFIDDPKEPEVIENDLKPQPGWKYKNHLGRIFTVKGMGTYSCTPTVLWSDGDSDDAYDYLDSSFLVLYTRVK